MRDTARPAGDIELLHKVLTNPAFIDKNFSGRVSLNEAKAAFTSNGDGLFRALCDLSGVAFSPKASVEMDIVVGSLRALYEKMAAEAPRGPSHARPAEQAYGDDQGFGYERPAYEAPAAPAPAPRGPPRPTSPSTERSAPDGLWPCAPQRYQGPPADEQALEPEPSAVPAGPRPADFLDHNGDAFLSLAELRSGNFPFEARAFTRAAAAYYGDEARPGAVSLEAANAFMADSRAFAAFVAVNGGDEEEAGAARPAAAGTGRASSSSAGAHRAGASASSSSRHPITPDLEDLIAPAHVSVGAHIDILPAGGRPRFDDDEAPRASSSYSSSSRSYPAPPRAAAAAAAEPEADAAVVSKFIGAEEAEGYDVDGAALGQALAAEEGAGALPFHHEADELAPAAAEEAEALEGGSDLF
eukprot:tig00020610_g11972.t1